MKCPQEHLVLQDEADEAHVAACERCRSVHEEWTSIVDAARALEVPPAPRGGRDALVAEAVLIGGASEQPPGEPGARRTSAWWSGAISGALAASVVAGVSVAYRLPDRPSNAAPPERAAGPRSRAGLSRPAASALAGARSEDVPRVEWRDGGFEVASTTPVRLNFGNDEFHLREGRVRLGVRDGRLDRVSVISGEAGLRLGGRPERRLKASDQWARVFDGDRAAARPVTDPSLAARPTVSKQAPSIPPFAPKPAAVPPSTPKRAKARRDRSPPARTPTPTPAAMDHEPPPPSVIKLDRRWRQALAAYREGRYIVAARAFEGLRDDLIDPLRRDEAGRRAALAWFYAGSVRAEPALSTWLQTHPDAVLRGEVHWARGMLRVARGDRRGAEIDLHRARAAAGESLAEPLRALQRAIEELPPARDP